MVSHFKVSIFLYSGLIGAGLIGGCGDPDLEGTMTPTMSVNSGAEMVMAAGDMELAFRCGDGFCHPSETAEMCEADCAFCGDQICNQNEDSAT